MFQNLGQNLGNALGSAQSFIFGPGTDAPSYEALKKKREIADLLMARSVSQTPQNVGEGISAVGQALFGKIADRRLAPKEDAERARVSDSMSEIIAAMGGGGGYNSAPVMSGREGPAPQGQPFALPQGDRAQMIKDGLLRRGLPEHVAEGFILNFQDESGLDPGINEQNPTVPGSRGGFGLAQWTGPRRKGLESYAQKLGRSVADPEVQLDYLMLELQGPEKGAAQAIMSAKDPGEAAAAIATNFLRPAQQHLDARVAKYTGGQGYSGGGGSSGPNYEVIAQLTEMMDNPYMSEGQRAVAQAIIGQQMQGSGIDPYQQARLELDMAKFDYDRQKDAQPNPTDDMREYDFAKSQGYTGTFQDFMISLKRAGATSITTNLGDNPASDAAFLKGLDEAEAKVYGGLIESAPAIRQAAGTLGILEQQLANAPQGAEGAWLSIAGELGLPIDGVSEVQAAQATINAMVPDQRAPGSGTMSDADLKLFKESLPRIINQPGGNQLVMAKLKAVNEYQMHMAQIAEQVVSRQMTREDARKEMQSIPNPLEGYQAEMAQLGSAPAAEGIPEIKSMGEFNTLPSGTRFKAPDGSIRVKP